MARRYRNRYRTRRRPRAKPRRYRTRRRGRRSRRKHVGGGPCLDRYNACIQGAPEYSPMPGPPPDPPGYSLWPVSNPGAGAAAKQTRERPALVSKERSEELRREYEQRKLSPEAKEKKERRDSAAELRAHAVQDQWRGRAL